MILLYHIIGREITVGLFLPYTVPSHNKHIFVRPKRCAYNEKCARCEKWRISHLRYSLYSIDSSIRTGLFVYYFRKKIFCLKKGF